MQYLFMLPQKYRLQKEEDFKYVFRNSCGNMTGAGLALKIAKNDLALTRFGFVVSSKITRSAVGRNLIKRRMREAVQKLLPNIQPSYDVVIIAQPAIRGKSFSEIFETIKELLNQADMFLQ